MNKQRKEKISRIRATLKMAQEELEKVLDEEQEDFDNKSEAFQESERGEAMQEDIDNVESASGLLDDVIDCLDEVL